MWEKTKSKLRLAFDILVTAGKEFGADKVSRMAAAVAYRSMFALAPLLLLATAIFGLVVDEARQEILSRVEEFSSPEIADAVAVFLDSVEVSGDTAAVVGVALLLWTASSLFIELQRDLNEIFQVPQKQMSGVMRFARKRLIGFLGVVGIGVSLIGVWAINLAWRLFGAFFGGLEGVRTLFALLAPIVSLLVVPVIFVVTFQALTAVRVRWRAVWGGGLFTSVAFVAASYGAGVYFAFGDETSAPRIAASIFVVLLLAFVLASVFFFGAEVTKVYDDYLDKGDVVQPSQRTPGARPEIVVSPPAQPVPVAALAAFLSGLFVGWWRRR